ncbi:MAG: MGMT family protein [Odoribacteraceae bacterium]|jgi:AraC family transcriptional regulator of adaptative response/methylated-DNA-[protein]-cysteine methyltransferase|nr:MGMT family protein [Odoribacteraceae bacterium]
MNNPRLERLRDDALAGLLIHRDRVLTPFGPARVAATPLGVCCLAFMEDEQLFLDELSRRYPGARLLRGAVPAERWETVHVRGTDFQVAVWRALLEIPAGETRSYGEIARRVGRPLASRAVGSAAGRNPASLLIPCHRLVRSSGDVGNYRWGVPLKRAILASEGYPR